MLLFVAEHMHHTQYPVGARPGGDPIKVDLLAFVGTAGINDSCFCIRCETWYGHAIKY